MKYLISYDLPSAMGGNKRRSKVAKLLETYGLRIQYSVFELDIPPSAMPHIASQLEAVIEPDIDSIRIYPLCGQCCSKFLHLGSTAFIEHEEVYVF